MCLWWWWWCREWSSQHGVRCHEQVLVTIKAYTQGPRGGVVEISPGNEGCGGGRTGGRRPAWLTGEELGGGAGLLCVGGLLTSGLSVEEGESEDEGSLFWSDHAIKTAHEQAGSTNHPPSLAAAAAGTSKGRPID